MAGELRCCNVAGSGQELAPRCSELKGIEFQEFQRHSEIPQEALKRLRRGSGRTVVTGLLLRAVEMSSSVAGMGLVAVSCSSTSPAPAPISSLASFSSHGNLLSSSPCVPVLVPKRTWKVRAGILLLGFLNSFFLGIIALSIARKPKKIVLFGQLREKK